jgi:DNA repair protein RadC
MFIGKEEVPVYHLELVRDRSIPYKPSFLAQDAASILHSMLDTSPVEQFVTIYLNSKGEMVGAEKVAMGDLESVAIGMRNIFRGAIAASVPRIVMGHNHPHGDPMASDQDLLLTSMAIQAGMVLGIQIVDHVIVSPDGRHFSIWDHQEEMLGRIDAIAFEKHMARMLQSHPFVDPFKVPASVSPKDAILGLLDKLGRR